MSVRGWFLGFDWSRSGGYGGPFEDVTGYVSDDDLTITVGRDTSQASSDIPAGTLDFTIVEKDLPGGYDFAPESSTSAIAGMVEPGVPSTLNVTVAGATTTLFTGTLDKLAYTPHPPAALSGTVMDAWGKPGAEKLSTSVYTGMRTGDLIGVVLDAIGWTGGRDIDPGATVVPFWWEEGTDAATAVQKLVDSEGPPAIGYVYAGTFVFRDRHHRILDANSLTSQATFTHIFPEGPGPGSLISLVSGTFEAAAEISQWSATGATFAQSAVQARTGGFSGLLTVTGSPAQAYVRQTGTFAVPVTPGVNYRIQVSIRSPTPLTSAAPAIDWLDSGKTYMSTSVAVGVPIPADTWVDFDYSPSAAAPPGAAYAVYGPTIGSSPATGTQVYVDDAAMRVAGDRFKMARDSFSYEHGLSSIVNTATFTVDVRTIDDAVAVWSTDAPISVAAGVTVTYTVNANGPFVNAQVPIPVSGFDSDGNPIDGDYILAYGTIGSISISRTSGQSLTLTIVGGGADALFTRMQVQANPVTVANSQTVSVVDAGSVAQKGTLTWPGALPWAGPYDAYAIAQRIVSVYGVARPVMTFDIDGLLTSPAGVSYMTQFVARQVSDRITVRHDLIGFNGDCHIEKVERVVRSLGKNSSLLRLTVEPVALSGAANPFTFNVAGKGFNDGQFDADGIDNPNTVFRFDVAGHGFDQGVFAS